MPFSAKGLDFLFENRLNNSKPWFDEHKNIYEDEIRKPLLQLVEDLTPTMQKIDGEFIIEPRRAISRVRRDTRYTHDKSIYRSNMWFTFMRDKKLYKGIPAFFFDLSPKGFSYGCGYYYASTQTMVSMRRLIMENHPMFLKAKKSFDGQKVFALHGEMYKRPRHTEYTADLQQWLDRRSISFNHHCEDFDLLFSDGLAERLKADFPLLTDIYHFMMLVEEQRQLDYPTE